MKQKSFLKRIAIVVAVLSVFFMGTQNVFAEINIKPFELSGQIREGILYDSNPGWADKDSEDSSWGNRLGGTIDLTLPFGGQNKYSLFYDTDWTYYFEEDKFTHWDSNVRNSVDLYFNDWMLNLHQTYEYSQTPNTEEKAFISKEKMKKHQVGAGFILTGDIGKIDTSIGFDYEYVSANQKYDIFDRDVYSSFIDLSYEIMPALDIFGKYTITYTLRRSDRMNNNLGHQFLTGVRGDITNYLAGELGVGWEFIDFKSRATAPDPEDYNSVVFTGSLTNRMSKNTTQKIILGYRPEQGYSEGHNYYKSFSTEYTITHTLNKYLNLTGSTQFIYNRESGPGFRREQARIFTIGGGVNWYMNEYITLGLNYDFLYRDSSRHGHDFRQHEAILSVIHNF